MSLSWGPADYAVLVLLLSWPGVVLGAAFGAVGWRAHRITGGMLGAVSGCVVCLAAFLAWGASDLSLTLSFRDAALLALTKGLPVIAGGAIIGADVWRSRRIFGGACGALVGAAFWLIVSFYLEGHQFRATG